jgi:hypothetical protein
MEVEVDAGLFLDVSQDEFDAATGERLPKFR